MNTRFKVLSLVLIFFFSYVIIQAFFSSDGFIANKVTEKRISSVEEEIRRKEGDLSSLRYRAAGESDEDTREKALVYSFSDDTVFDPRLESADAAEVSSYEGLSTVFCVIIALSVTLVYGLVIMVVVPLVKRRRKGAENGGDY